MFHEITDQQLAKRRTRRIAVACAVACVLVAAFLIVGVLQTHAREQAAALRESIINAAKQCCAIEGSYPASLEHLEENYGVVINDDDYVVSYESFADNVMPTVVVTPR